MNLVIWGFASILSEWSSIYFSNKSFPWSHPGRLVCHRDICLSGEARGSQLNIVLATSLRKLGVVDYLESLRNSWTFRKLGIVDLFREPPEFMEGY